MYASEYEPKQNKHLSNFGMTVMTAVLLLLLVAATGILLMQENGWSVWSLAMLMVSAIAFSALLCMMTARGSQRCMPARPTTVSHPAPLSPGAQLVHKEARFVDRLVGVEQPLGESFDILY